VLAGILILAEVTMTRLRMIAFALFLVAVCLVSIWFLKGIDGVLQGAIYAEIAVIILYSLVSWGCARILLWSNKKYFVVLVIGIAAILVIEKIFFPMIVQ
jgi:hypothetical protein